MTRADGSRVRGVYERQGVYYAYVRDSETGKRKWVRAPGQTVADAEAVVKRSGKLRDQAEREAFQAALAGARRRSECSSLRRVVDAYREAAELRFRLTGKPQPRTAQCTMWVASQVFDGKWDEPADRTPQVLSDYLLRRGEEIKPISRKATLRRVQSLFSPWAREHYERAGVRVPARLRWPELIVPVYKYRAPPEELRRKTIEAGKAEIEKRTPYGAAFLLCYFAAMACADAARARWDWLGADGRVRFERQKTGKPCDPPLSQWALAQWRAWAAESGRELVLDTGSRKPIDWLHFAFRDWMHGLGWPAGCGAHELRKMAASLWMSSCGLQYASRWIGDNQATCERYYADCLPEMAPTVPES